MNLLKPFTGRRRRPQVPGRRRVPGGSQVPERSPGLEFPRIPAGPASGEADFDGAVLDEAVLDDAAFEDAALDAADRAGRAACHDRDPGQREYMNWVAETVSEHGWAVSGDTGSAAAPPWAYSVGMWLACQGPELVLCGLPMDNAAAIINVIGRRAADAAIGDGGIPGEARLAPGLVLDDVCPAPLALRPVDASWRKTGLLATSDSFYGMVRPAYLQVVWSDRNGRFPWDAQFQRSLRGLQPLLWLPRDDNPPSAWTRLPRAS